MKPSVHAASWVGAFALGLALVPSAAGAAAPLANAASPVGATTATATGPHTPDPTFGPARRAEALRSARADADGVRRALGLSAAQDLVVVDVVRDADGAEHVRYQRTYQGLPVIGGDLVAHETAAGNVTRTDRAYRGRIAVPSLRPTVSADAARADARAATAARSERTSGQRLVVWAVDGRSTLAYQTRVRGYEADTTPVDDLVYTSAGSGKVLGSRPLVQGADGSGRSLYSGTVPLTTTFNGSTYELNDGARGGHKTYDLGGRTSGTGTLFTDADNVWGDGTTANRQSAAVDAHYGAAKTWDYYKNVLGRTGIRNDGVAAYSRVHYSSNYDNAFWSDSCFCMTYGDGSSFKPLVSLDVAGHEMTHGVTSNTAGLTYSGESGGLNESTSDVFGTMVEFYSNTASDPGDYYIGEEISKTGTPLRRMDDPDSDGSSANCWYSGVGNLDVHYSSGVGNHLFYLLSEGTGSKTIGGLAHTGSSCNGSTLTGVGRDAAAKIWYRALTTYMTSSTNYRGARDAMILSASDLYGAASTQCAETVRAWDAVSVPAGSATCGTTTPPPSTGTFTNGGFESGATGWTGDTATISTWSGPHAGTQYAWLNGYGSASSEQVSQSFTVPASGSLKFWTRITTRESGKRAYDTLKVQVVSGTTTTTLATYSNANKSTGWVQRSLSLSSFVGKPVTLRFVGTEDSTLATDFRIDDVAVS